jgi:predicted Zn-dependent peptidase
VDGSERFFTELLDSGVQVVGQAIEGVQSAAVGVLIGAGARDEDDARAGISHFTEQMLFRGTEHLDARQISDRFDALGINRDSSAGLEMTVVTSVLIGDRMPAAIDLLAEVIRFPAFPEGSLDSVRAIILQERRQREDRPAQKVMELLRQRFFAGSPLGHDVLGTPESLASIGRPELQAYWSDRYTANNMVISLAGNLDWDASIGQLRRITGFWPHGRGRMLLREPTPQTGVTVVRRDAVQEHLGIAFPGVPVGDPHYYATSLMAVALGGSAHSRLFREVRENRGLAYAVQARFDGLEKTGMVRIYVGTSAERAHQSVEVVMDELRKLEADGITEDELRRAKTRLKSQLVMRSESTSSRMAANLRSWWFEQKLYGLDEVRDRIDRVTVEEIGSLLLSLGVTANLTAVAVGPREEEELFGGVLARS